MHPDHDEIRQRGAEETLERESDNGTALAELELQNRALRAELEERRRVDEELRRSEQTARALIDASPDSALLLAPDGAVVDINERAAWALKTTREELRGRCVYDFLPPKLAISRKEQVERVLATGEPARFEDLRHGRIVDNSIWPQHDEKGRIWRLAVYGRDITTFKKAEAALWAKQQELEVKKGELRRALTQAHAREAETAALLEAARVALGDQRFETTARAIFDIACRHTGARSGYVAMLSADGAENEVLFLEAGGSPCDVDPELPMPIRGLRAEAYREQRPVFDNEFTTSEWMRFMPAGHARLDNVLFAPIIVGERAEGLIGIANKPGGFDEADAHLVGALSDLAAVALRRLRDQRALSASEHRFHSLFETASDAIFIADPDTGMIIDANRQAEALLAMTRDELLGLHQSKLHPPEEAEAYRRLFSHATQLQGRIFSEVEVIRGDGRRVPVEVSSGGTVQADSRQMHLGIFRDITERKRMEDALRASEARLRTLSGRLIDAHEQERQRLAAELHDELGQALLAHKLRLRAAVSRLPIGNDDLYGELEELLEQINQMVEGVRRVARELSPAVLENLGLGPAVEWLAAQGRSLFGFTVDLHLDPIKGLLTPEAERAVFRIIQEALTNTGKHARAQNVVVRVEHLPPSLVVSLSDDGRGFGLEEPQQRPDERQGLGLMLMKERARLIDGALDIQSKRGEGTRVALTLPLP